MPKPQKEKIEVQKDKKMAQKWIGKTTDDATRQTKMQVDVQQVNAANANAGSATPKNTEGREIFSPITGMGSMSHAALVRHGTTRESGGPATKLQNSFSPLSQEGMVDQHTGRPPDKGPVYKYLYEMVNMECERVE